MTPFVPERDGIDQEVPYLELEGVGSRGPVTGLGLEAAVMEIDLDVGVSARRYRPPRRLPGPDFGPGRVLGPSPDSRVLGVGCLQPVPRLR